MSDRIRVMLCIYGGSVVVMLGLILALVMVGSGWYMAALGAGLMSVSGVWVMTEGFTYAYQIED